MQLALLIFVSFLYLFHSLQYHIEDINLPENCVATSKSGDHLLIEFYFNYENSTEFGDSARRPNQLFHLVLESEVINISMHAPRLTIIFKNYSYEGLSE